MENNNEQETIRAQHRVIFYALLEQAMRFREHFWREEMEDYWKMVEQTKDTVNHISEKSFSARKKQMDKIQNAGAEFQRRQEEFNRVAYATIERMENGLSPENKVRFDNYSTSYGLAAEELARAENTTDFLTVCRLYNEGYFNEMLKAAAAKREQEGLTENFKIA